MIACMDTPTDCRTRGHVEARKHKIECTQLEHTGRTSARIALSMSRKALTECRSPSAQSSSLATGQAAGGMEHKAQSCGAMQWILANVTNRVLEKHPDDRSCNCFLIQGAPMGLVSAMSSCTKHAARAPTASPCAEQIAWVAGAVRFALSHVRGSTCSIDRQSDAASCNEGCGIHLCHVALPVE